MSMIHESFLDDKLSRYGGVSWPGLSHNRSILIFSPVDTSNQTCTLEDFAVADIKIEYRN